MVDKILKENEHTSEMIDVLENVIDDLQGQLDELNKGKTPDEIAADEKAFAEREHTARLISAADIMGAADKIGAKFIEAGDVRWAIDVGLVASALCAVLFDEALS